jgi:hypothetical protein
MKYTIKAILLLAVVAVAAAERAHEQPLVSAPDASNRADLMVAFQSAASAGDLTLALELQSQLLAISAREQRISRRLLQDEVDCAALLALAGCAEFQCIDTNQLVKLEDGVVACQASSLLVHITRYTETGRPLHRTMAPVCTVGHHHRQAPQIRSAVCAHINPPPCCSLAVYARWARPSGCWRVWRPLLPGVRLRPGV